MKDELIKMGFEYDRSSVPDPINFPFCTRYLKDPYVVQESEEGWLVRKENPQRHYPIIFEKLNYTELLLELNKLLQPPIKEFLKSYGFTHHVPEGINCVGEYWFNGKYDLKKDVQGDWNIHIRINPYTTRIFRDELSEEQLRQWVTYTIKKSVTRIEIPNRTETEINLEQLKISKLNLNL